MQAMAARQAVTKEKPQVKRAARPPVSDDRQLEQWFTQFDAKQSDLSARQDAFLQYLERRQPRQS
jgi:hypothetical protein